MIHIVTIFMQFKLKEELFLEQELIGKKIQALRKTRGMTQIQLADALGLERASISNYETGRRYPSLVQLEAICKVLGVSLEYFGVENNEVHDLIARAKLIFSNNEIPLEEKSQVYKEVMKLYLNIED